MSKILVKLITQRFYVLSHELVTLTYYRNSLWFSQKQHVRYLLDKVLRFIVITLNDTINLLMRHVCEMKL